MGGGDRCVRRRSLQNGLCPSDAKVPRVVRRTGDPNGSVRHTTRRNCMVLELSCCRWQLGRGGGFLRPNLEPKKTGGGELLRSGSVSWQWELKIFDW